MLNIEGFIENSLVPPISAAQTSGISIEKRVYKYENTRQPKIL